MQNLIVILDIALSINIQDLIPFIDLMPFQYPVQLPLAQPRLFASWWILHGSDVLL